MDAAEELEEQQGFDPDARRLCPDDTCTGLIGANGRCKVCGAISPDGAPPADAPASADRDADEERAAPDDAGADDASAEDASPAPAASEPSEFDPEERILCPDDTCTGLVGPGGTCKVCGAKYEP